MNFSEALHDVKNGFRITRAGWNGPDQWVAYTPGFEIPPGQIFSQAVREAVEADDAGGNYGRFRPYLIMRTVQGDYVPWLANQSDILADDWEIVR